MSVLLKITVNQLDIYITSCLPETCGETGPTLVYFPPLEAFRVSSLRSPLLVLEGLISGMSLHDYFFVQLASGKFLRVPSF